MSHTKLILTYKTGGWDNALEIEGVSGKKKAADARNEIQIGGAYTSHGPANSSKTSAQAPRRHPVAQTSGIISRITRPAALLTGFLMRSSAKPNAGAGIEKPPRNPCCAPNIHQL